MEGRSSISDEPALILELDEDRNQGRTTFKPGQDAFVRVYPRPFGIAYEHQITLGQAVKLGAFTLTIEDEEILVADGRAVTRYPVKDVVTLDFDGRVLSSPSWQAGGQEIIFEVNEGCSGSALLHLSYHTQYDLWRVTANQEGKAILCIEEAAVKATIAIEFAQAAEDQDLILELDDVKNAGASSFVPGADVWIRAYTQSPITVREATQGKLRVHGADLRIDYEEEIRFEDSQEAQLDRPFIEVLSAEWIGSGLGALTVSGRTVRSAKQGYGVAKIAYTSAFTRLKLSDVGKAGTVIAWTEDAAGRKGSLAVSFAGAEDDRDVVIVCPGLLHGPSDRKR